MRPVSGTGKTITKMRPSHKKSRIFVIGLDSADFDLIQRWSLEGRLPFLTSLTKAGVWARLASTSGIFSDSPWPSFNTGVHPGKHGFYNHLQLMRGTSQIVRVDARWCGYLPFWWLLRGAGKKTAVFDVPKTYPLEGIDGIQVAAWGEEYPLLNKSSLPLSLVEELSARFGRYFQPAESVRPRRISQERRVYDGLRMNVQRKIEATQFLMAQDDWDLFITVFAEAHFAGHHFYHHFDQSHWAYPNSAANLNHALPNIYAELDSALAALLKGVAEDATIFIVSVHGIEPTYSGNFLLPVVLKKLAFQEGALDQSATSRSSTLWKRSRPLREFINEHIVPKSFHDKISSRRFSGSIDWHKTKAFFIPTDHFQGFISVNLKGREPSGVIRPGQEYEEVCGRLCYELKRLVNPDTGKPAARDVIQTSKIYDGENLYILPDIVVCWSKDGPIQRLHHPALGVITGQNTRLRRSQHSDEGFMIASGRHIHKGAAITGASTMDVAPTILYLLGQAIPDDMDGKVLWDLIDDKFKRDNKAIYRNRPLALPEEMTLE